MNELANHLWQSTVVAWLAALAAFALRSNQARTRYWLWLAASIKFLVPFSLLVSLGTRMDAPAAATALPAVAVEQITHSFAPAPEMRAALPQTSGSWLPNFLAAAWFAGSFIVMTRWCRRLLFIRSAMRHATPLPIGAPIPVVSSPTYIEPGVFGIFRSVLVLPDGIANNLSAEELDAILAHELSHVRRRDNLTAAFHMLVEAIFWFHPLVWWIGAKLIEERERACDEEVLRLGKERRVYAEGILNVCKHYLESPLPCVSGVTGADLKKRIEEIMTGRISQNLSAAKKFLLAAVGTSVVAVPILVGLLNAPRMKAQVKQDVLKFDVASIRPSAEEDNTRARSEPQPGGGLRITNIPLRQLIVSAYDIQDSQLLNAPGWIASARYNILAKLEKPEVDSESGRRERIRSLLAERFHLAVHKEAKEIQALALVVARGGFKLEPSKQGEEVPVGTRRTSTQLIGRRGTMEMLATVLSHGLNRPVVDQTGIKGHYDYTISYPSENAGPDAGPSIYTSLQEELGLKLEPQKIIAEEIVIDRVERPTEN